MEVYPNPSFSRTANVTLSKGSFTYEVLNLQGVLIMQGVSVGSEATLHLGDAASGIYLIRIADEQNNTYFEKLLIGK